MEIKNPHDDAEIQAILQQEIFENPPEEIMGLQMDGISDTAIDKVTSDCIIGTCVIEAMDDEEQDMSFNSKYTIEFDDDNEVINIKFEINFD